MIHNDLQTIKESIEMIEKFQENFPKKIVCNDVRWQAFFDWEARLCFRRRNELLGVDNILQQPLLDI